MTNEEIILNKIATNNKLGSLPIMFRSGIPKKSLFYYNMDYIAMVEQQYEKDMKKLETLKDNGNVLDRVNEITLIKSPTYYTNGRFQCHGAARRSTIDIWRLYKYYFGDIDIFSIMRALFELVLNHKLNTYRCPDIRKRVFWRDSYGNTVDLQTPAELGVPFSEWKNIGLNVKTKKISS